MSCNYLKIPAAVIQASVSRRSIERAISEGRLRSYRPAGCRLRLITEEDLHAWITSPTFKRGRGRPRKDSYR